MGVEDHKRLFCRKELENSYCPEAIKKAPSV